MGYSSCCISYPRQKHSSKVILFLILLSLAVVCSHVILIYISKTSELLPIDQIEYRRNRESLIGHLPISAVTRQTIPVALHNASKNLFESLETATLTEDNLQLGLKGISASDNEVYHDGDVFLKDYKEMNRSFKIYVYPHRQDDPFANILLPTQEEPTGNYASEHYFKNVLMKSHFITEDPSEADLFYMPFSIVKMRRDPRIDVPGIPYFVRDYVFNISQRYPYWNRTGGADHFYVCCHSIGKKAAQQAASVKLNAIQVVCSANYFVSAYIPRKDASMPQIWNRPQEDPQNLVSSERNKLAFFAGRNNSPVRERVHRIWGNDTEIRANSDWVSNIAEEQLGSKFCLHVKGYEVNTARASDALLYGCVPVIIANHYHLPFADVVNWKSFSVVLEDGDIPSLKKILKGINSEQYLMLRRNVLQVRKHFQWHTPPVDYDAFYTTMYQLWLRRSAVRISSVV
ncbi:hypothetical protein Pint_20129 [Pistacia integerrima]|uniref:Uncharacterized protein n=1 Tax=Pistacia integerrima TaxID=434235 RepID=A0ACC0XBP8_9ROSI|nr:hypothetical protein Pint_20129 [Pistacia integerrima]